MERILFIRLSALGDVVMTLPALTALRFARPDVRVDWLVEDRFADLLRLVEGIEEVIVFPRRQLGRPTPAGVRAFFRHDTSLRRARYSAAIDFQGNLKGALALLRARAERKIGLDAHSAREGAHRFARVHIPLAPACHRVERALTLVRPLGVGVPAGATLPESLRPVFRDLPEAAAEVEVHLASGTGGDGPVVLIHPGTSAFGAFKRWPAESFGALARNLAERRAARVWVVYGPGEKELAHCVEAAAAGAARCFAPTRGLAGLVALQRRADLVIGADSGPLVLAAALGVPTVTLFGPKDPAVYASPYPGNEVVRQSVPCSPCSLRSCADPICMAGIEVEPVVQASLRLLA